MKNTIEVNRAERLYKIFIYLVLGILAVLILVPVLWVMVASVKETTEHYGSPWALPSHIHWQNFTDAWNKANMGGYMLHSVTITAMALGILLVVALPASYCLSRSHSPSARRGRNQPFSSSKTLRHASDLSIYFSTSASLPSSLASCATHQSK